MVGNLFLAATSAPDVATTFLQYGVVGAVALVLAWFAYKQIVREQKKADLSATEVTRLNNLIIEKTVPQLTEATISQKQVIELLTDLKRRQDIADAVDKQRRDKGGQS